MMTNLVFKLEDEAHPFIEPVPPQWYVAMRERESAFNAQHPRCIGCGKFVKKSRNICADCYDWPY